MRLIDLDDDKHVFCGSDGEYEKWNIDPTAPAIEERKTGKWIPCSERLPKKEYKEQRRGVYLTTNGYGVVGVTNYEFEGDFGFVGWGTNRPYDIQIVAWMPLPEPWKGEEE